MRCLNNQRMIAYKIDYIIIDRCEIKGFSPLRDPETNMFRAARPQNQPPKSSEHVSRIEFVGLYLFGV